MNDRRPAERVPGACKKLCLAAILGALLVPVLLGGCSKSAPKAHRGPVSVGVYAVQVKPYTLTTQLPGRTSAYLTSQVRPQVSGIIQKRLFREGSDVKAGQVLYQIDPATYQAAYDTAKAELAQARAVVQSARPLARRYKALSKMDAVSKQDLDNALATLAQDEATVQSDEAKLETARINLDYTRIKAPISGRIGASAYTPGALVTADQTDPLATINQLNPIYVDITQTSTQFLALRQALRSGQLKKVGDSEARVQVTAEGDGGPPMKGRLEFAGVTVDQGTGTVMLRAIVPNPNENLLPGMYVTARLVQGVDVKAILVPQQAVTRSASGQASCLVVGPDNKVTQRNLTIAGSVGDRFWRITSGLTAGDRVIVQGTDKVRTGQTVKPVAVVLNDNGHFVTRSSKAIRPTPARAAPASAGGS